MEIDYNKLKIFMKIVESGSVTAASKILCRTQSAVSQSLNSLEQNLGLVLIEWEGKRLKLTREGEFIYRAISNRIDAIDTQLNSIIAAKHEVAGCIEIGVLQDDSTKIREHLLNILVKFREKYPKVIFKVNYDTSFNIEQALLSQKLDFGLLINFRERHHFHIFEVVAEEHIIVSSPKYLEKHPIRTIKDVAKADLIDIDFEFTCFTPWIRAHNPPLVRELNEKTPVFCIPEFRSIKEVILLGSGIGVVPRYLVEKELKTGKFIQILPKLPALRVSMGCAILRKKRERLCDILLKEKIQNWVYDNSTPLYTVGNSKFVSKFP